MGKSKKLKFSLETGSEISNESSTKQKISPKIKKKKNKTLLPLDGAEEKQKFVSHRDKTEPIKKKKKLSKKKKNSLINNVTEADISESLVNGNEETPTTSPVPGNKKQKNKKSKLNKENESMQSLIQTEKSTKTNKNEKVFESAVENAETEKESISKKKSNKRKRDLADELASSNLEEAIDFNVRKKKKHLADENGKNVEEPESGSKVKKSKLKNKRESNDGTSKTDADSRDSRTVFIGNVPMRYKKKSLLRLLKEKGGFEKMWTRGIKPSSDKISKKTAAIANLVPEDHPPIFVYALFKTTADAKNALTLNGAIFEDHRLRVTLVNSKFAPVDCGVFVGNLPQNITDDDLFEFFSHCGEIVSTRAMRNEQGRGKGIAYVNFKSSDSVELALKLNGENLRDREIRVLRLKNKRQMEKMQKRKALLATRDVLNKKKNVTKTAKFSSDKSDKLHKKKKKVNSTDIKKKILAEKLTSKTKRREKKSE